MRKGRDGEKREEKKREEREKKEKTDENSCHYVIASSRPPERQPLEHCTLVPISQRGYLIIGHLVHRLYSRAQCI